MFDPDTVSLANIGRQRFLPCDVGFNKAEVLISRMNNFAGTNWHYANEKYHPSSNDNTFDILITCVDSPKVRADIGKSNALSQPDNHLETLWIDCGNDAHSGNVVLGHLSHGESSLRLPNVYDLYPILDSMESNDEPSCSTEEALHRQDYGINRSVAREAANLLWRLIRHGQIEHHGSYIDIKEGTVHPLSIDASIWQTFATA